MLEVFEQVATLLTGKLYNKVAHDFQKTGF